MFFPARIDALPGTNAAAAAVRDLGLTSQLAYWVPAGLMLIALRRIWAPLLVAEAVVRTAVGVAMFWCGLTSHLIAIAGSVIVTVTVLTTVTRLPGPGPGQKLRSETTV